MDEQTLKSIVGGYGRGHVPHGIEVLTAGMDLTQDAVHTHVWGWGKNCRALIDWDVLPDPRRLLDKERGINPVKDYLS